MNFKKSMTSFACMGALAAMSVLAACSSDDEKNPSSVPQDPVASSTSVTNPESNPSDNSGENSGSSGDKTDSSTGTADAKSSSSAAPVPTSSEKGTAEIESSNSDGYTYVAITEIMYNAPEGSDLEWVELTIQSGPDLKSMAFYQMRLEGAVTYSFPAEALKSGEYIVVTNNPDLFKSTYPQFAGRLFGPWDNDVKTGAPAKLSNEGDVIEVKITGKGDVTAAFSSEPPWPSLANGKGYSLVYKGGNSAQPSAWAASRVVGGNPGVGPDEYITKSAVRLNEIKPYVLAEDEMGWIELYNSGADPVDVSGWLFESKLKKKSWTIQGANTVVPAMGYLLLKATADNFGDDLYLSEQGGEFYLYEMVGGNRNGSESSLMVAASQKSSGVVEISDGTLAQGALVSETPGEANTALSVGSLIINEIHYHPVDGDVNDFEFMEIVNKGAEDVSLFETISGASKGWKVEGVNMEFTTGDMIPAGGMLLLLPDSLEASVASIREKNSISDDVKICFYKGKLSNRGEMVAIKKPFSKAPRADGSDQWYFEWSDATLYSDSWPGEDFNKTDGFGFSLQRKDFSTMGYEASAWVAAKPTPGK